MEGGFMPPNAANSSNKASVDDWTLVSAPQR